MRTTPFLAALLTTAALAGCTPPARLVPCRYAVALADAAGNPLPAGTPVIVSVSKDRAPDEWDATHDFRHATTDAAGRAEGIFTKQCRMNPLFYVPCSHVVNRVYVYVWQPPRWRRLRLDVRPDMARERAQDDSQPPTEAAFDFGTIRVPG